MDKSATEDKQLWRTYFLATGHRFSLSFDQKHILWAHSEHMHSDPYSDMHLYMHSDHVKKHFCYPVPFLSLKIYFI